jgi:hypothetical protein
MGLPAFSPQIPDTNRLTSKLLFHGDLRSIVIATERVAAGKWRSVVAEVVITTTPHLATGNWQLTTGNCSSR